MRDDIVEIAELIGKTIEAVLTDDEWDGIRFVCSDGSRYDMYHYQECCENVKVESIVGDENIIGSPVLNAVARTGKSPISDRDYSTWTFYTISTVKGYCDIRWSGDSETQYSDEVRIVRVAPPGSEL